MLVCLDALGNTPNVWSGQTSLINHAMGERITGAVPGWGIMSLATGLWDHGDQPGAELHFRQ